MLCLLGPGTGLLRLSWFCQPLFHPQGLVVRRSQARARTCSLLGSDLRAWVGRGAGALESGNSASDHPVINPQSSGHILICPWSIIDSKSRMKKELSMSRGVGLATQS